MPASDSTSPGDVLAIFDHDGVLVDSFELHLESWLELGRRENLAFTRPFLAETFGMTNAMIFRRLIGAHVTTEEIARLSEIKEVCYREGACGRIALMDGVPALLDALTDAGAKLAIGSSAPRANLDLTVRACGLDGRFAAVVGVEEIRHGKPDPEVFLKAAARTGVPPARCIVFEDAAVGVQAAKAAGMTAVGVGTTRPLADLTAAGADAVVPDLRDFPVADWLDRLRHKTPA